MNDKQTPFEAAFEAAGRFSNPLARSLLLAELAKVRFGAGLIEDAFTTIAEIPNRAEKKGVLLHLALDAVQSNRTEHLERLVRTLVETDPNSASTAGRLALSLLERETPDVDAALGLLGAVGKPFDSDRNRYDFFEKLLETGGEKRLEDIQRFAATFTDKDYADWARLALAKRLAKTGRWPEAEKLAAGFSLPRRQSWAFFELARISKNDSETKKSTEMLRRSAEILEAVDVEPENAETLAAQLRILGKAACSAGERELGHRLLEQCEATAAKIALSVPRFKSQLYLARVLRRLGLIAGIDDYLDLKTVWREKLSGTQRSLVLQWVAEAKAPKDAETDWIAAVREAARQDGIPGNDFPQAERIVEIVKRYGNAGKNGNPGGDPRLDAAALSGEEFEEYYFSPFAIDDCGC